jgi:hypothetical protein
MNGATLPIGTEIATFTPSSSEQEHVVPVSTPPVVKTTGDLLALLRVQPPPSFGMLKTTCRHLGTYLEQPGDQISFETIAARKAGFRDFLVGRHYVENSIRGYVYQVQVLLSLLRSSDGTLTARSPGSGRVCWRLLQRAESWGLRSTSLA